MMFKNTPNSTPTDTSAFVEIKTVDCCMNCKHSPRKWELDDIYCERLNSTRCADEWCKYYEGI